MGISLAQVLTDDNLFEAWLKVKSNQGCAGVDGESIEAFGRRLFVNLDTLRNEVNYATYRPQPLLRVVIEEVGKKPRPLSIPTVRDRVLQSAVARVLNPVLEVAFEDCSFAYRQGRSVDMAVRRVVQYRDEGYRWVVDADIRSFFDEIDHSRLLATLSELVTDPALLQLIRAWLTVEVRDGDRLYRLRKGVPQGSPISPLLANLYLDHLDDMLLENGLRLVRYADDFLLLCKDRERAERALELTEEVLASLRLRINEEKTRIVDFDHGFRFLGVDFVRSLALKRSAAGEEAEPLKWRVKTAADREFPHEPAEPLAESALSGALCAALTEAVSEENIESVEAYTQALPDFVEPMDSDEAGEVTSGHDPRLRTLYIMGHGCVLAKESERLLVKKSGEVLREVPAIKVDQVLIFGNSQVTTPAMNFCLKEKIPIVLLSSMGRYYGVVDAFDTDPVLLHRDQFLRADDEGFCLDVAKAIVHGKLANSRVLIARYSRKREVAGLSDVLGRLRSSMGGVDEAHSLDQLRGVEGAGARAYFSALRLLVGEAWQFTGRKRQPPPDPVNAMLSYGYTLLFYNVYSLLRARGLNPHVGFLHPLRSGHPALVSDLMEEFRAIVVDAVVLSLILGGKITPDDFTYTDSERPCLLSRSARKTFIEAFEKKMNATLTHPHTGQLLDYRRCIETQVQALAALVRGRQDAYKAVVLR